jgi:hypothetical protein
VTSAWKHLAKAARLLWRAWRNPMVDGENERTLLLRLAKSEVLPHSSFVFNVESPTTTRTWYWGDRPIYSTTVTNPFWADVERWKAEGTWPLDGRTDEPPKSTGASEE